MTTYKILYKDAGHWEEGYPDVEAASPRSAVRKTLEDKSMQEGEFVAVPARSWNPVKVQVETALKFT